MHAFLLNGKGILHVGLEPENPIVDPRLVGIWLGTVFMHTEELSILECEKKDMSFVAKECKNKTRNTKQFVQH